LAEKPEGKRRLGRPRLRWEDNIKMDLREIGKSSIGRKLVTYEVKNSNYDVFSSGLNIIYIAVLKYTELYTISILYIYTPIICVFFTSSDKISHKILVNKKLTD
jgi:hypothetical protein